MTKFRLARKIKKSLKGKFFLYPPDEKGNRQMAFPARNQQDYDAIKKKIVLDLFGDENNKVERKQRKAALDNPVLVTDEELRLIVDEIFAEKYRTSSYSTLIAAKNNPKVIIAYYNFVNAYNLSKPDDSFANICCLAVDSAKSLLRKYRLK